MVQVVSGLAAPPLNTRIFKLRIRPSVSNPAAKRKSMPRSARTFAAVCLAFGLASCAHPINRHNAAQYHGWGQEAERAGNFALAERNYGRALVNARLGHSPDAGVSMAMYNLGRVKGYLCKYDEAERLLLDALALEEKVSGPESGLVTMRLFELARLQFDRGHYAASLPWFSRAIPAVRKLGAESSDPIALAEVLDQYALALARAGRPDDGAASRREADALRAAHPGKGARFKPVSYDQPCRK
jgi:tetratricopeptide (TPR) repeat protein